MVGVISQYKANASEAYISGKNRLALPVCLYVISIVTPILMRIGPLQMSVTRIVLMVMIIPLTVQLFLGRFGKVFFVDYMFFGYIGWMTLSMAIVNPDRVVENTGSAAIEFLGAYVIGRAFIRSKSDFIALIRLVGLIVLLTLPLALIETINGQPVLLNLLRNVPGISTYGNIDYETRMGLHRVQTVFAHPIHHGLFCSMSFAIVYVGLAQSVTQTKRILYGIGISAGVFLSLSSGALLALLLQTFLIAWGVAFQNVKRRWLLLAGLLALLYLAVDLSSNRTPLRVFMSYATFSPHNAYYRSIIFDWGLMNVMGNPAENIPSAKLFGIGLNDWVRPSYMYTGSVDNFWLVIAMRNGLPALAIMASGYVWLIWKVGRRDLGDDPVLFDLRRAWMISFVGLTFTLATVHVWGSLYSFVFFMFGSGAWFLMAEPESRDVAPDPEPATSNPSRDSYTRFPKGSSVPERDRRLPAVPRPALASRRTLAGRPAALPTRTRR